VIQGEKGGKEGGREGGRARRREGRRVSNRNDFNQNGLKLYAESKDVFEQDTEEQHN
jgi:hypothetical protein